LNWKAREGLLWGFVVLGTQEGQDIKQTTFVSERFQTNTLNTLCVFKGLVCGMWKGKSKERNREGGSVSKHHFHMGQAEKERKATSQETT
jgi:hypothetical protein